MFGARDSGSTICQRRQFEFTLRLPKMESGAETLVRERAMRKRRILRKLAIGVLMTAAALGCAREQSDAPADDTDDTGVSSDVVGGEEVCNQRDDDGDGVADEGCALGLRLKTAATVEAGDVEGVAYAQACKGAVGRLTFRFRSEQFRDPTLYGEDYELGRMDGIKMGCRTPALVYDEPDATPRIVDHGESETREWESDDEKYLRRRFTCGSGEFVSGIAGVYRDTSYYKMRAICSEFEFSGREEGEWLLTMRPGTRESPCFETPYRSEGTCEPLAVCPDDQVVRGIVRSYPTPEDSKNDQTAIGLIVRCAEPDAVVLRGPTGGETEEPLQVQVESSE